MNNIIFRRFITYCISIFLIVNSVVFLGAIFPYSFKAEAIPPLGEVPDILYIYYNDFPYITDEGGNIENLIFGGIDLQSTAVDRNLLSYTSRITTSQGVGERAGTGEFLPLIETYIPELHATLLAQRNQGISNPHRWVYDVHPDENFYSIDHSLMAAMQDENLSIEVIEEAEVVFQREGNLGQWVSHGSIDGNKIEFARLYQLNNSGELVEAFSLRNDAFLPSDAVASAEPFPITARASECVIHESKKASFCPTWERRIPEEENTLAKVHADNFAKEANVSLEETNFVFDSQLVDGVRGRLHAPLQESNELLQGFDAASGIEGYKELTSGMSSSITRDIEALGTVTKDANFVSKTLEAASLTGRFAKELIPYAAIGLTGYAISEDAKRGDWVNLGFDSTAEGLMALDLAGPEVLPFTEVALVVLLTVQNIVDYYKGDFDPPKISPEEKEAAAKAVVAWDYLPKALADSAIKESTALLLDYVDRTRRERLLKPLKTRLDADLRFLGQLQNAYAAEIHRQANRTIAHSVTDIREHVEVQREQAISQLHQQFRERRQVRVAEYALVLQEQTEQFYQELVNYWSYSTSIMAEANAMDNAGNFIDINGFYAENTTVYDIQNTTSAVGDTHAAFEHFIGIFEEKVAIVHIEELEKVLWSHYQVDPNSITIPGYGEDTRVQFRKNHLDNFRNLLNITVKSELELVTVPHKIPENELLLFPVVETSDLVLDELRPFNNLSDSTIHIAGGGLGMDLESSNIVRTVTMENDFVNAIFSKIGRTKVNVYSSEKELVFTRDSKDLDLGNPQIRRNFYNSVIGVPNGWFMEFVFENPAPSMSLSSGGATRVENVTRYVVENKDNSFVAWNPYGLNLSDWKIVENSASNMMHIGGANLSIDASNSNFVLENKDIDSVNDAFRAAGRNSVKIYASDYSFVRSYDSSGMDMSIAASRKSFYDSIPVLGEGQFLKLEFEHPMSVVFVGDNVRVREENTIQYVAQRKDWQFAPWVIARDIERPDHLRASIITHNSVSLEWNASSTVWVDRYEILSDGGIVARIDGRDSIDHTISHLDPNTHYSFTIRAGDGSSWSPESIPIVATTSRLEPPTNLRSSTVSYDSVTLEWDASVTPGITQYDIFRNNVRLPDTVSGTSHRISGLTPDTSYTFTLRAKYTNHVSDYSRALEVRTRAGRLLENGRYSFRALINHNKLLDLDKTNNNVSIWEDNVREDAYFDNQLWDIEWSESEQAYRIFSAYNSSLALAVHNNFINYTNDVVGIFKNSYFADNLWEVLISDQGFYIFRNRDASTRMGSEMVLDVYSSGTSNGTNVQIWSKNLGANQQWKLTRVPTSNSRDCVSYTGVGGAKVTNNCSQAVFAKVFLDRGKDSDWTRLTPGASFTHSDNWGLFPTVSRVEARWAR